MKVPLEMIQELVSDIVGQDGVALVSLIFNRKNVSEFKIADKLEITVNQVRNILYRLGEYNLVDFTRKKDRKKGMYIYYWTFDNRKALELIINTKKKRLAELRNSLKVDKEAVKFRSPADGTTYNYAQALELGFRCPESNEILDEIKPEVTDQVVREEMKKLREELNSKILKQSLIPVVVEPKKKEKVKPKKKVVKKKPKVKVKKKVKKKAKAKKKVKKKVVKRKAKKKVRPRKKVVKRKVKKKVKKVVRRKAKPKKKIVKRRVKPKAKPKKKGLLKRFFKR